MWEEVNQFIVVCLIQRIPNSTDCLWACFCCCCLIINAFTFYHNTSSPTRKALIVFSDFSKTRKYIKYGKNYFGHYIKQKVTHVNCHAGLAQAGDNARRPMWSTRPAKVLPVPRGRPASETCSVCLMTDTPARKRATCWLRSWMKVRCTHTHTLSSRYRCVLLMYVHPRSQH